jgi:hypothetical protein
MATSNLKERIQEEVVKTMRAKDKERLSALRMLTAAIKQKEVDTRVALDDAGVLAVIDKMIKQRRESAVQFEQGNRPELAAKERAEITLYETFMPAQLSAAEIDQLIEKALQDANASTMQDMGKVMNALKDQLQGRANMAEVSAKVKTRLS